MQENLVEIYLCGHTAYKPPHLGNLRPVVVFDLLIRILRRLGRKVRYIRNTTDIDDKIIHKAAQENLKIEEIVDLASSAHRHVEEILGCIPPTINPYATAYISRMLALIAELITKGMAYESDGHVLFKVKGNADFYPSECLAKEEEFASYKYDQRDFVLWKPSEPDEPGWPSPYGIGRPGWHTECVAMILATTERLTIHGGGCDLRFPHHANELLQLKEFGHSPRIWMHTGMLTAGNGQKMSKSAGNTIDVAELAEHIPGVILRIALLSTHYRQPLPWTPDKLEQTAKIWQKLMNRVHTAKYTTVQEPQDSKILEILCNNLNTPQAFAELEKLSGRELFDSMDLLGFFDASPLAAKASNTEIEKYIEDFLNARKKNDYTQSDKLRKDLAQEGIVVQVDGSWHYGLPKNWREFFTA